LSFSCLTFSPRVFFKEQLKFFAFCFLFALPLFILNKQLKEKFLFILYIFLPVAVLTFIPAKWSEYTMYLLPAVSIVFVSALIGLSKNKIIVFVLLVLCGLGVIDFIHEVRERDADSVRDQVSMSGYSMLLNELTNLLGKDINHVSTYFLNDSQLPLFVDLEYWKSVNKKQGERGLLPLLSVSFPKLVIEHLPNVKYVIYHTNKKDQDWPSLSDIELRYNNIASLDKSLGQTDFLKIVAAKKFFRLIKRFRLDTGNVDVLVYINKKDVQ
jgi:hypothetical protein